MHFRALRPLLWLALFVPFLLTSATIAQVTACPVNAQAVLRTLDAVCGGVGSNRACYGAVQVNATFRDVVDETFFSQPADQAALEEIARISATAYDPTTGDWGAALLNLRANLPTTLPGQSVRFVLLGNASLENAVPREADAPTVTPVPATVTTRARVRSGPSTSTNVVTVLDANTPLAADALNQAGTWVRVQGDTFGGWMLRELLRTDAAALDGLPRLDDTSYGPMQAFYFRGGIGVPECESAPNVLLVQSPRGAQVTLGVNEAEITLGSTIAFYQPEVRTLAALVIDGTLTSGELVARAGSRMLMNLVDDDDGPRVDGAPRLISADDDDPWSCGAMDDDEYAMMQGMMTAMAATQNLLLYTPSVSRPANACARITVCTGFRPTSPLDGMANGQQAFFFNPPQNRTGIARYRVNLYNEGGALIRSFTGNSADQSSITGDTSGGSGFVVSWEVEALGGNGAVVCRTQRVRTLRSATPSQGGGGQQPPGQGDNDDDGQYSPPPPPPPPPPGDDDDD